MNKTMLVGNLGRDPEVRMFQRDGEDRKVASISLATNEYYGGEKQTEWHRLVLWGKIAEVAEKYLVKGRKIGVEGSNRTRSWEDPDSGVTRYITEVHVQKMEFLDSNGNGNGNKAVAEDMNEIPAPVDDGSEVPF